MRAVSIIAVLLGLLLVGLSFLWPSIVGGKQAWSETQAQSFTVAAGSLHRLSLEAAEARDIANKKLGKTGASSDVAEKALARVAASGVPIDPTVATADRLAAQLTAAQKRYDTEKAAFDEARTRGHALATAFFWLGIVAVLGGIGGIAASGGEAENNGTTV
ncbi:MAG TPA: hypothetical protein VGJ15_05990 [Pirellulales bacterium]|jgi:hypothetical protein